eukprot:6206793-Pleurochrysis_carterae.AAC.1
MVEMLDLFKSSRVSSKYTRVKLSVTDLPLTKLVRRLRKRHSTLLSRLQDESQVEALQAEEEHAFDSDADDADAGLGGGNGAPATSTRKLVASVRASGDDLEDDFAPIFSGKADDDAGYRGDDNGDGAAGDVDASGDSMQLSSSSKRKHAAIGKGEKQPDANRKARKTPKVVKF